MRTLAALALLSIGPAATAQSTFRLVEPLLSVDGERVPTWGAPLAQDPFGVLTISVPGEGTYTVSERPFAGAQRAGQFDGDGLYFATAGRSVRLLSRVGILSSDEPTSAYVRYEPSGSPTARGPARLSIADGGTGWRRSISDRDRRTGDRDASLRELSRRTSPAQESPALRRSLAGVTAERDRLARERDRLETERARLSDALARSEAERAARAATFGDVRRRAETAPTGWARSQAAPPPLQSELAALRTALQERDHAIERLRAERDRLATALADREAVMAERDRLLLELQALRTRPAAAAAREPQTVRTPTARSDGGGAFLPGFDFGRLANPDVIRRRLAEAEYPRWATVGRIEGDVLVLFQTDRAGRVVSTAVPTPLGGGLDGLAEELVREMRFVRGTDDASGLRSQVVVRFER